MDIHLQIGTRWLRVARLVARRQQRPRTVTDSIADTIAVVTITVNYYVL